MGVLKQAEKAFDTRAKRETTLGSTIASEGAPGPGEYGQPERQFARDSESFSKRGYGSGFVSKESRFNYRRRYRAPGPGKYDLLPLEEKGKLHGKQGSSSFAKHVAQVQHGSEVADTLPKSVPGPGKYSPRSEGKNIAAESSFKSTSTRTDWKDFLPSDLPPPGAGVCSDVHFLLLDLLRLLTTMRRVSLRVGSRGVRASEEPVPKATINQTTKVGGEAI